MVNGTWDVRPFIVTIKFQHGNQFIVQIPVKSIDQLSYNIRAAPARQLHRIDGGMATANLELLDIIPRFFALFG